MESIANYYAADHDRLDGLFKTYQQLKRKDFAKAKTAFVEFFFGLKRHIIWEEDLLFPLFEKKTGVRDSGPTAVMRVEHVMIRKELEAIHAQVAQANPETDEEEGKLISVLTIHNQKEEAILYPMIDRCLHAPEIAKVFEQMGQVPPERYAVCC